MAHQRHLGAAFLHLEAGESVDAHDRLGERIKNGCVCVIGRRSLIAKTASAASLRATLAGFTAAMDVSRRRLDRQAAQISALVAAGDRFVPFRYGGISDPQPGDDPERMYWVDRDGIAGRMVTVSKGERATRLLYAPWKESG